MSSRLKAASGLPIHSGSDSMSGPLCCLIEGQTHPLPVEANEYEGQGNGPDKSGKTIPPLRGNI